MIASANHVVRLRAEMHRVSLGRFGNTVVSCFIAESVALDDKRRTPIQVYCRELSRCGNAVSCDEATADKSHFLAWGIPNRGLLTDLHAHLLAAKDIDAFYSHASTFVGCDDAA